MKHFTDWFRDNAQAQSGAPWLLFGKGPGFSRRHDYDLTPYLTMSLNHAVCQQTVTIAHVIDFDVLNDCREAIDANAQYLVMPWIPHVNFKAGDANLDALVKTIPILQKLDRENRLLWYNLSTAKRRNHPGHPVVTVQHCSAEAALNLLVMSGATQIRSLGVDGGRSYSGEFAHLADKTLLANGLESFDKQFASIAQTVMRTGIDYAPLGEEAPVKVFVGSARDHWLPTKVLEYSIRKNTLVPVEVFPMYQSSISIPQPRQAENRPKTPFSFQRFLIPELNGFKGRGIYMDSDMLVFGDIREIWSQPLDTHHLLTVKEPAWSERRSQYSVMLLDCDALDWRIKDIVNNLDNGTLDYDRLMHDMCLAPRQTQGLPLGWNDLERYSSGETRLIHYTDMRFQPWFSLKNQNGALWVRELIEAVEKGFISLAEIEAEIDLGYIRPSLLYQVKRNKPNPDWICRVMDLKFVPNYRKKSSGKNQPENASSAQQPSPMLPDAIAGQVVENRPPLSTVGAFEDEVSVR